MTYEERKKLLCEQCGKPHQCGYVGRGLTDKCPRIDGVMEGWELGWQDAIKKAAEWLEDFCVEHEIICYADCHEIDNSNELVEIFKKKMED